MKRYKGGNPVPSGIYMKSNTGELVQMYGDIRLLPGTDSDKFVRLPGWLAVLSAPVMGLGFIIFLPLAGILGLCSLIIYKSRLASTYIGRRMLEPLLEAGEASPDTEHIVPKSKP